MEMNQTYELQTLNITAALPGGRSLQDGFMDWLQVSDKTLATYKRNIRPFMAWMTTQGESSPTFYTIKAYKEHLEQLHKPATVNAYLSAVKCFFDYTDKAGIYPNVAKDVKGCKLDKGHKKDYLTSNQVKQILAQADGQSLEQLRNYAMLALMFTGGLRTIEVARANVEDLAAVGDTTVLYVQGKGHSEKGDFVKVAPQVEQAIRAYMAARGHVGGEAPLFASLSRNNQGGRMTTRAISGIVKAALVAAGFNSDRLTAHSTRHTAVTLALLNGESLQEVQKFARHTSINTTQIYAHNIDRARSTCEAGIANAIFA